jgi:hypothetical protein
MPRAQRGAPPDPSRHDGERAAVVVVAFAIAAKTILSPSGLQSPV